MKNVIMLMIFLVLGSLGAQDFSGIKIYINPGHGGHDPANDRYIAATGFWESEGNLTKGLHLRELLENAGATIFMSRTENRDIDDLPLSQISADANANNVDYFHSIHSNAANATVNYPLLLFRGYDAAPVFPEAKEMGSIMWYHLNEPDNQWIDWPYSWSPNNRGDWDFYPWGTSGLGVLRGLVMPGTLSEGTFHDYIPNAWRLMSIAYREYESILIFRAFIEFYQLDQPAHGAIAGIVRDRDRNVTYAYSVNNGLPNDKYLTVDNTRVRLVGEDRSFLIDFNKNGFYLFDSVATGEYQLIFDNGEYLTDTLTTTVAANKTSFLNAWLTKTTGKKPEVFITEPAEQEDNVPTHAFLTFSFSQKMHKGSVEQALQITPAAPGVFKWADNYSFTYQQTNAFGVSTNYQVFLDSSAMSLNNVKMAEPFTLNFTTAATHVHPKIASYYPDAETDSADIYSNITIRFDSEMRSTPTESAFRIEPEVAGTFVWDDEKTELAFVPDGELARHTQYTVTIGQAVENTFGIGLTEEFSFSFWTRERNEVGLVRSYPAFDAQEISTNLVFAIEFNSPIALPVFASYLELKNTDGVVSRLKNILVFNNILRFQPSRELDPGTTYNLVIKPDIKDIYGLPLQDTVKIEFSTQAESFAGTVIEPFEIQGDWQNPTISDSSAGLDPATSFTISSAEKISDLYSGMLEYTFANDSNGVCHLSNSSMFETSENPASDFALWVYGDFSGNNLEVWFEQGGGLRSYKAGKIDWMGWKMIKFPISELGASGLAYFEGVVIRQAADGNYTGTMYFDDAQIDVVSGFGPDDQKGSTATAWQLEQNYPNPFNPVTTIAYRIGNRSHVNLSVYNVLGQQIAILVNDVQNSGEYRVTWDAGALPSGVYYYRISSADFQQVKKLLLIK